MLDFFAIAVVLLFILALVDLSVGVSNDAVNFLNSAIGSRVATRRTIMIVASLGILCGAVFSSGMMEVARKGIFNPEVLTFGQVMAIFLAVMLADVILLDLFNTFGLPTSTTVSIVFELLGAAFAVATLHVMTTPDTSVLAFINLDKASAIVAGIVLSVAVAFSVGLAVQFVSRLIFAFDRALHSRLLLWTWAGIAMTAIVYFLLIKGLKGASFVGPEMLAYFQEHALVMGGLSFVFWFAFVVFLSRLGFDPLKVIVLAGTFSLAMAFAGNDLVNFIGVPLAGMASYTNWQASQLGPENLLMGALAEPVRGNTVWLLGAGAVMVLTLWVSAKARSVTDTEVNLGRQDEGSERFLPGAIARTVVRSAMAAGKAASVLMPSQWRSEIDRRFERPSGKVGSEEPAFDLIRASVNLAVASVLIAIATSMKLPLSTTYVSFMVAMGTSLADRAWGRDSAVYRVSGVLTVIAGWFATALIAFLAAGIFATVIRIFEAWGVLVLVLFALAALVHSHRFHRERSVPGTTPQLALTGLQPRQAAETVRQRFAAQLERGRDATDAAIGALLSGDAKTLGSARQSCGQMNKATASAERRILGELKHAHLDSKNGAERLLMLFSTEKDLQQSVNLVHSACAAFVHNIHSPVNEALHEALDDARARMHDVFDVAIRATQVRVPKRWEEVSSAASVAVSELISCQLRQLERGERTTGNARLILRAALGMRDIVGELNAAIAVLDQWNLDDPPLRIAS
ncbi:MAG: inorganic phosphate transporter [Xanthomonadales bacterium]|nr:inorganic phosphate transporter [Xanthomonadales bacterium]